MKKTTLLLLAALSAVSLRAQTFTEWHDSEVNQINRAPMHAYYKIFDTAEAAQGAYCDKDYPYRMSLNGTWRFNWVENADQRPTDFYTMDYNDAAWNPIEVPGMWEMNGYGDPIYVNVGYAWRNNFRNDPPNVPVEQNHVGSYRRTVNIPADWTGRGHLPQHRRCRLERICMGQRQVRRILGGQPPQRIVRHHEVCPHG